MQLLPTDWQTSDERLEQVLEYFENWLKHQEGLADSPFARERLLPPLDSDGKLTNVSSGGGKN